MQNQGELHEKTLQIKRDIGVVLLHKREFKKALEMLEDVLENFRRIYEESHPEFIATRVILVGALMNLNELDKAVEIGRDVCRKYKNTLGANHLKH
ncbi:hypothetical protein CEXT_708681 [Caerostris extrusa]|uniref:Kinesin light chain n=1 Tax=Caerostris extrusa TaxID=172846 RepID=A0AAV4VIV2_CAEEX|nr:hypothetical protein CEXT_708681 [Caerostris extrusa]